MDRIRKICLDLLIVALSLILGNAWILATTSDNVAEVGRLSTSQRVELFLRLMTGPVEGWLKATREGTLDPALPLLLAASAIPLLFFVLYLVRDSKFALVCGTIAWLVSGYGFSIAIWV